MSLSHAVDVPPPRVSSLEARARVMAVLVGLLWFDVLFHVAHGSRIVVLPAWLAATAGLTTQLAFTACEAAVAVHVWRSSGAEVTWRALAPRLFVVSSAEAFALSLATESQHLPPALGVMLAGMRAAGGGGAGSGLAFAFAAFGALTVTRLLLSAHAQSRTARAPFARGLAIVLVFYLVTRLVMWWGFDLLQGRSFETWGTRAWPSDVSNA